MNRTDVAPLIRRENYAPPAFWIKTVDLTFDLDPAKTLVTSRMQMERNTDTEVQPLRLHGEDLNLLRIQVNGESVSFRHEDGMLVIDTLPEGAFTLEIRNTCAPDKNTQLSGLYTSNGGFFTQCEAEGFRRITYFLDRPDVMAIYTVTLRAAVAAFPVLLSNGNLIEQGDLPLGVSGKRHFAKWHDPFPKPSYLFALVAADLVAREQNIRTRAGKDHLLQVFVRRGDLDKTEHAMNSLIASLVWDEARFQLPLDLERFMIVAVGDFNMGAMENKGLNIFNTKYVLAHPATATDSEYAGIESVVGHEYFHNWTGNRITCRDWFQLSLKEGLTVFRDQEFSMDMASSATARAVKRIEDVRHLRQIQFPEDAGPMSHPVRPDQYEQINNFYTATVYDKGAEVVRMMQTLVGRDGFAKGMALYFERHDGQAVTCDDFAQAIAGANPNTKLAQHLTQFKRWYSQSGTPRLIAHGRFDAPSRTYTLGLEQQLAGTQAFVIPVAMGLMTRDGQALSLQLEGETQAAGCDRVLVLTELKSFFTFVNVDSEPVPSLLRGFSAPVSLTDGVNDADLLSLLQHDTDPFVRWDAAQRLALSRLLSAVNSEVSSDGRADVNLDTAFVEAMRAVLRHPTLDAAFKELVLTLPNQAYVSEQLSVVDPQRIHAARQSMAKQLGHALHADWEWAYGAHQVTGAYSPDAVSSGKRALANAALCVLCCNAVVSGDAAWPGRAYQRVKDATNMTDRAGALAALVNSHAELAASALEHFYAMFKGEDLVVDNWFMLQALAPEQDGRVLNAVKQLLKHPAFSMKNPNRARSVLGAFALRNPTAFHRADAAGYVLWADRVIELDTINPQLAARIARSLDAWAKLAEPYRSAAHAAISRVAAKPDLSADVREIVSRALAA
ncbi:MAG: aminopeptidase N [Pseudorhodobacter sp.]|nr:aminopeptidase N [Rhizobacter sp.]